MKKTSSKADGFRRMTSMFAYVLLFVAAAAAQTGLPEGLRYELAGEKVGAQGTYLVKVSIYTKKKAVTPEEFKCAAVHGVIFRGFTGPGMPAQKPMAAPETEAQYAEFYRAFFQNGDYAAYARVVNPTAERVKMGKKAFRMAAVVAVSKDALRKKLEEGGVIRSLNSGF
ncbi:MAG: hypothetical protein LBM06_03670 [Prevotellaceae bacterium]|jgi:hypothetical protein|nr:hypothetical protein [Prevotellaceae bacterium]